MIALLSRALSAVAGRRLTVRHVDGGGLRFYLGLSALNKAGNTPVFDRFVENLEAAGVRVVPITPYSITLELMNNSSNWNTVFPKVVGIIRSVPGYRHIKIKLAMSECGDRLYEADRKFQLQRLIDEANRSRARKHGHSAIAA